MKKLNVELPNEIHKSLKKKAVNGHKTINGIITKLVDEYLYTTEKHVIVKKETGLCGSWDDDRTADEIIKDIKISRRWFVRHRN